MRNVWRAAAVIGMGVLAAGIAACGQSSMGSGGDSGRQVTVFENFTAQDLDGNPVDESIFQGYDVTMINLWGTFCGPCLQEMPDLGELADEYGDKGVQIVGICTDAVNSDGEVLADVVETPTGEIFTDLLPRVSAVPTTIFVDESGRQIGLADMGARDKDTWIQVIEEKLAEAGSEEQ